MPDFKESYLTNLLPKTSEYDETEKSNEKNTGRLVIRVRPNGVKTFYFYYYTPKRKKIRIGVYGKLDDGKFSLIAARKERNKYTKMLQDGHDPKEFMAKKEQERQDEEKHKLEEQRKKDLQGSIKQLKELYCASKKTEWSESHYKDSSRALSSDFLKKIDISKKASEITSDDISKTLHIVKKRGKLIAANRLRAYLSAMFKYGLEFDYSDEAHEHNVKFFIKYNPVLRVGKVLKQEKPGERYLEPSEVKKFWAALNTSGMNSNRIACFKLMFILGQRVSETSHMEWSEISKNLWTIPSAKTKNRKGDHVVPLNEVALEIIRNIPRIHEEFVFPDGKLHGAMKSDGFSQALSRILIKNPDIAYFTPRDLRRSFKTLAIGDAKIDDEILKRIQNHALSGVADIHYNKYKYLEEKIEAMKIWNEYLVEYILNKERGLK